AGRDLGAGPAVMRGAFATLAALVAVAPIVAAPRSVCAQLAIDGFVEVQGGNTPFAEPRNRTDTYAQVNGSFAIDRALVGLRYESNRNSEDAFTYEEITQRYFEIADERFRLRLGNVYTILGNGLLHRSFELPGVVLDQAGLRSRWGFARDVDGVLAEGRFGPVELRGLSGKPGSGEYSPAISELLGLPLHRGELLGGQAVVRLPRDAKLGAAYTRFSGDGSRQDEFGSGFLELDPLRLAGVEGVAFPIAAEYARREPQLDNFFKFRGESNQVPSALYASSNLIAGPFALSAEWKDYTKFRTGINDPPSLVREHSFPLLNRSTHVLASDDEEGYQLEASYRLERWGQVVANVSRGDGLVSPSLPPRRFSERFVEVHLSPVSWPALEGALFYDSNRDDFEGFRYRETVGISATARLPRELSASLDVEHLKARRTPDRFEDDYLAVSLQHATWGSAALVWQRTTDPAEERPRDAVSPGVQPRHYLSGVVSAQISERHRVIVTAGQIREGLACTAGTCYKVLAFEGAQLRIESRF
ncbi:MAG: hypothetical protein HOP12_14590, partial [Candidatus Eisenbacteria bacterium]|nr:hypothetical protein [Candidatus Eisenbacteria bacterium]